VGKVYIIVLAWNQFALTLDCVRSLLQLDYLEYRIVVVDNGSFDGTVDKLRHEFGERIDVIAIPENVGFTGGNNIGICFALEQNADYIMLLNNDTLVNDPALVSKLVAVIEADSSIGLASPSIYYGDTSDKLWYAGADLSLWRGWRHHHSLPDTPKPLDTGHASGCCVMASSQMIRKIGLLPQAYFLNVEDVEWSLRAKRNGWRVVYVPSARVLHQVSASQRDPSGAGSNSPVAVFYMFRNTIWLIRQYGNFIQRWIVWPTFIGFSLVYHAVAYIVLGRWPKQKAMLRGLREGLLSKPPSHGDLSCVSQSVEGECLSRGDNV
jgi:GT2 family glycosyltransferase